jgi:Kef-type K+ transport system membrane component KefB
MSLASGALLLVVQIAVILAMTSLCGALLQRLRQPRVVGEIAGGLLLGPLALGRIVPSGLLFPPAHLEPLQIVSNIGLVLFLFLMGAEIDLAALRKNRGVTLAVTLGSIGLPFALGAALAPTLRAHLAPPGISRLPFLLFIGIAMSITALPVLARILQDRKTTSRAIDETIAATSLLSAAANDLLAWSLLAIALALTRRGDPRSSLTTVGHNLLLLVVFVAVMLGIVRPIAKRALARREIATWALLLIAVPFAFLSAHISDVLGFHAFFGAFLAGLCFPIGHTIYPQLQRPLQPIVRFTLPVFFALTGLRMDPAMLSLGSLGWLALILAAAIFGKLAGSALAARASGMQWRSAAQIGALLNTRGLVELIALNIGYRHHILSPAIYTLFVLMALLTTAMTSPLLDLLAVRTHASNSSCS